MNYIYDILVNFKETLYDFYEWNKNDNITHIRKIPLFRINDIFFKDFYLFTKKLFTLCTEKDIIIRSENYFFIYVIN